VSAATARHRGGLGPGALADMLSSAAALLGAVRPIAPTGKTYGLRALRPLADLLGGLLAGSFCCLPSLGPARLVYLFRAGAAIPRPSLSAVGHIAAMAARSTNGPTCGFAGAFGGMLQPGGLNAQLCATRCATLAVVWSKALRARDARLFIGRQARPAFPFLLIMNQFGDNAGGQW
jgi:hypothetical protein